jgi:DNA-binding NarL/FixJ family response regulator
MDRGLAQIGVFLVDDHALLRDTLSQRLEAEHDLQVVGSAETGNDALVQMNDCLPDVVLLDIDMPGITSFEAARRIRDKHPEARFIFVSAFSHDRYIEGALIAGASGYVTKDEPPETVVRAIRQVMQGTSYFSQQVQDRMVVATDGVRFSESSRPRTSLLTERELEILRHIARGLAKKEIARMLHISFKTVDRHVCALMAKLDIHDRVELARFAIREGLAEA